MADNLATFMSFTGASSDQAQLYLEMAGGDVENAVAIFFSSQDGGGPPPPDPEELPDAFPAATRTTPVPSWWRVVWPAEEAPPPAWRDQGLSSGEGGWAGGIPQPKNGPCGVLAVVHGLILAAQHDREPSQIAVTPEALADALISILTRCRPTESSPVRLVRARSPGAYGPDGELEEADFHDLGEAAAEIRRRIASFQAPGGAIDLVYSAVQTRGIDLIRKEAEAEGGELPLVTRAFDCWLCTTELLSLLLRGTANGNVGAVRATGEPNDPEWHGVPIGLLSSGEKEQGVPVVDALKTPKSPVWILHGGSHFTVAWARSMPALDVGARFTLYHWNGLPPGGPRLAELSVHAVEGTLAGGREAPKYYKPQPGEIDDIIQADPEDKKALPDNYRMWRFEVLLAWDDPSVQGEAPLPGLPPQPRFDQEDARYQRPGAWRCRSCYAKRFQTMDFSLVPATSPDVCNKCGKPRKECGWSLWIPFADLPPKQQAVVMGRHAKNVENVLWTKWPSAEISAVEGPLPDA